jgi:hypothetical protein
MFRVIMTWDIQENKEQDYIDFAIHELNPTLGALGLQLTDVWYTLHGSGPEMILSGLMTRREDALGLIRSRDWLQLRRRLSEFVEDVRVKVVKAQGPFQM